MKEVIEVGLLLLASNVVLVIPDHSGEWSKWSECSKPCDGGQRTRNRTCEHCNTTLQTQSCNTKACHDVQTQIVMISVTALAVISILTTVLVIIFFMKGNKTKPRSGSNETSKRLRTVTLDRVTKAPAGGLCVENRAFQMRNMMANNEGSPQTSKTTLKEFGESTTPRSSRARLCNNETNVV